MSSVDPAETENTTLNMLEVQQTKTSEEKDERMVQALIKSQEDASRKLGEIFVKKKLLRFLIHYLQLVAF